MAGEEASPLPPHRVFAESLDVTAVYPGAGMGRFDEEQIQLKQTCSLDETFFGEGNDCPWIMSSADCWETHAMGTALKFVFERRMTDHYEFVPEIDAFFKGRAGFELEGFRNGAPAQVAVQGDEIQIPLFGDHDGAAAFSLAMSLALVTLTVM